MPTSPRHSPSDSILRWPASVHILPRRFHSGGQSRRQRRPLCITARDDGQTNPVHDTAHLTLRRPARDSHAKRAAVVPATSLPSALGVRSQSSRPQQQRLSPTFFNAGAVRIQFIAYRSNAAAQAPRDLQQRLLDAIQPAPGTRKNTSILLSAGISDLFRLKKIQRKHLFWPWGHRVRCVLPCNKVPCDLSLSDLSKS